MKTLNSNFFRINFIPIVIQIIFTFAIICLLKDTYVYSNFIFYLCILVYFIFIGSFSPREWYKSLKLTSTYKSVGLTLLSLILMFCITLCIEAVIPSNLIVMIKLPAHSPVEFYLFILSTSLLAPIAEELFYRKNLIMQGSKKSLIVTSVFSCVLYALNHTLTPVGIILVSLRAVPFVISYLKTGNIYVPMTAHLLLNLTVNVTILLESIR